MTVDSVLLVEDDHTFSGRLSGALEAGGYDVDTVRTISGAEALNTGRDYAAIVLSLEVRDRAPESLLRSLAADPRQPAVVLLASHFDIEEMAALYDYGCVFGHRSKPLEDLADLMRDLARAIEFRQLKQQNSYLLAQLRDSRDDHRRLTDQLTQVQKSAGLGWISDGLMKNLDAMLDQMLGQSSGCSAGRVMRVTGASELAETLGQMQDLVADARAAMRGSTSEFRPVNLASMLASVASLYRVVMSGRDVEIAVGPVESELTAMGDGPSLRTAVSALLQNALQATDPGGTVEISLMRRGSAAHLYVKDAGAGMDEDVISRAFDPFFTARAGGESTGLGLTVAKEIIHAHGGEIVLASMPGEGTAAVATLPLCCVPEWTNAALSEDEQAGAMRLAGG